MFFSVSLLERIHRYLTYGKASERSKLVSSFWGGAEVSVVGLILSTAEGKRSSFVNSRGKLEGSGGSIIVFQGVPGHLGRGDSRRSGNPSGRSTGSAGVPVSFLATSELTGSDAVSALSDRKVSF